MFVPKSGEQNYKSKKSRKNQESSNLVNKIDSKSRVQKRKGTFHAPRDPHVRRGRVIPTWLGHDFRDRLKGSIGIQFGGGELFII